MRRYPKRFGRRTERRTVAARPADRRCGLQAGRARCYDPFRTRPAVCYDPSVDRLRSTAATPEAEPSMNEPETRLCDADGMARPAGGRWRGGSPSGRRGGAPLRLVGVRTRGRADRPAARRAAAAAGRRGGPGRRGRHHALPRRPRPGRPLAGPARDRDPVRRRRRRDRPGRRRPVHRADDPRGPERDLRPGPARVRPPGGPGRSRPPRAADPARRRRPARRDRARRARPGPGRPGRPGRRDRPASRPTRRLQPRPEPAPTRSPARESRRVARSRPTSRDGPADDLEPQAPARAWRTSRARRSSAILDTAESFAEISTRSRKKVPALQGRIVFNLFFENSTRTRTSFSLAAKRLSADTQDFTASVSSLSKGETFIDTAKNIEAMGADVMVVRHPTPGAPHLLAQHVKALDHQRRRRRPRAPDPGPARPHDDPPRQGADRGPDRRPGRRHQPLAGRPLEHLGPDQARRPGDPLRPADPRPPGHGAARLRGRLPPRRRPPPLRRRQRPPDPVRAPAAGPVPLGRRVLAVLRDDPGAGPQGQGRPPASSPPARSTGASS